MASSQGNRNVTYVYYFLPGDGDTEEHPNVFPIPKAIKSITVQDIRHHFPLPGSYFFRFKQEYGKGHVWLDNQDPSERAPIYSGRIFCKVSRISFEDARLESANLNEVSTPTESTPTPSPASTVPDRSNAPQSVATGDKDQSRNARPGASSQSKPEEHGGDLFGMGGSYSSTNNNANGKKSNIKQQQQQDVGDLVDIDTKGTKKGDTSGGMAEFEGLDFGEKASPNRNQQKSNTTKSGGEDLEENIFGWA